MMVEQCVCRLCGDIREEQIGSEAMYEVCDGCKEGKFIDADGRACCVYCHEVSDELYEGEGGVYSHLHCQMQHVLDNTSEGVRKFMEQARQEFPDVDEESLPPIAKKPKPAIHAVCTCNGKHIYLDSVDSGDTISLDQFYCVDTNKYWLEP